MQLSNNTIYELADEPNLQKQNTNFGTLKQIIASQKKNANIYQKIFILHEHQSSQKQSSGGAL